jgi:phosphoribosylformimino-5-aminoimidazole carboxamide ribonucleotide (ProFAR) isomerase
MSHVADGVNVLAYRHQSLDGAVLLEEIAESIDLPVIAAGSIDSLSRIRAVVPNVWGFTIGAAVLDRRIVLDASLRAQIESVLAAAA